MMRVIVTISLTLLLMPVGARGQGLESRVAALEAGRADVTVTCGAPNALGAVLAEHAGRSVPLFIRLVGVCVESVTISRDQVILFGGPEDGVQAPAGASNAITVLGGRVSVVGLSIQAQNDAIVVSRGGSVSARNLAVTVGHNGIAIQGGSAEILNSTIDQTMQTVLPGAGGVRVTAGTAVINGVTIRNFAAATGGQCGICADGSSVTVRNSTIEGNNLGINASGSYLNLFGTVVRAGGGTGIELASSSLTVFGGAISDNAQGMLMIASYATFSGATDPPVIEANAGPGIRARLNSVVRLDLVTIRGNGGAMQLSDGSVVFTMRGPGTPTIQITANQRGVICLGSPGVGGFGYISSFGGGAFDLDATNVFGNGPLGPNISCPGIFVP